MNIYDLTHQLAKELKQCPEYVGYTELKNKVSENQELSSMINDFQEKNMQMQTQQMLTGQAPADMTEQIQSLYQILMADPLAAQYLQAEFAFTKVVADIYGILGEVVRLDK